MDKDRAIKFHHLLFMKTVHLSKPLTQLNPLRRFNSREVLLREHKLCGVIMEKIRDTQKKKTLEEILYHLIPKDGANKD